MLTTILKQKATKLKHGGFDLSLDPSKPLAMTFGEYAKMSVSNEKKWFGKNRSLANIEDQHWLKLCKTNKLYAMNNQISLFGDDVTTWNLDRFTKAESNIHGNQTHHTLDVSMICIHKFVVKLPNPYSFIYIFSAERHGWYPVTIFVCWCAFNIVWLSPGRRKFKLDKLLTPWPAKNLVRSYKMCICGNLNNIK